MLAALRIGPVIAMVRIVVVINMAVKIVRPMKPGSGSDEDAAAEPLRAVITVRGALIRGG